MVQEIGDHPLHVSYTRPSRFREPLSIVDAENFHTLVVLQARKQFRRDEEVLSAFSFAGHLYKLVVHCPLITLIHTLDAQCKVRNRKWHES